MILAGNFKMNHTRLSTKKYIEKLNEIDFKDVKVYIFPPFTALDMFETEAVIGAQNAYCDVSGSYTGEIGLEQLNEFRIKTLILGHSERRHIFNETQELIAKKFDFFKEQNFKIFYCIGESAEVKDSGSKELIYSYLTSQLEGIDLDYENLIIAYEPVWAIGTGKSALVEDIEEMLGYISTKTKAPLLYGGSVNISNIKEILSIKSCSGALVGSASWKVDKFKELIEVAKEL
jgi:triosephosphate isomerase